eukprot:g13317.t1
MSLFVRITRGLHAVESTRVLSSSSPMCGDGVENNIGGTKRHPTAAWSWRWGETLAVPGLLEHSHTNRESEREARGEGDEMGGQLTGPCIVAVHDNEGCRASSRDDGIKDTPCPTTPSEAVSTSEVVSGDDAAGNLQGDGDPSPFDVDANDNPSGEDSTDSSENRQERTTTPGDKPTGEEPALGEAAPTKANAGARKKRGVSFWSPRRGRRNTDVVVCDQQGGGVYTAPNDGGAEVTTPDAAALTGGGRVGNGGSSSDPETSESDIQQEHAVARATVVRSTSSTKICPEVLAKVKGTVAAEEVLTGKGVDTEAKGGVIETKKTASFWGPRRRRRGKRRTSGGTSFTTIDEPDGRALSRCGSEASGVFNVSDSEDDREEAAPDDAEDLALKDESGIVNAPHDRLDKKLGVSFWSARRGRKNTDAASGDQQTSTFCTIHHHDGELSTTPDATVVTADERSKSGWSSTDSETTESDNQRQQQEQHSIARNVHGEKFVGRSASSCKICPEVSVKGEDNGAAEGAAAGEAADTEACSGVRERKKAVSFWGPGRRRGNRHTSRRTTSTIDESGGQPLSRCDSEASTVFDISDPEDDCDGTVADNAKGVTPDDEPGAVDVQREGLKKTTGGSFWGPRRKRKNANRFGKEGHSHGDSGRMASTTNIPGKVATEASSSREHSAKRGPLVPWADLDTSSDVILLEIWEEKASAASNTRSKNGEGATDVTAPGFGKGDVAVMGSPRVRESEETCSLSELHDDTTGEGSQRRGSGEGLPAAKASEHPRPQDARVDPIGDPPTAHNPAARGRRDTADTTGSASATEGRCVDDDRILMGGDGISAVADEATVAGTSSAKSPRRKRALLLLRSPRKGRRTKGDTSLQVPPSGRPPMASSGTETPRGSTSSSAAHGNDSERCEQQDTAILCEIGERETSEAPLDSRGSNVPEENSTDLIEDCGEMAATAKQVQKRSKASFLSSYNGWKPTGKDSPQSAAKLEPVLWGRVTIRVADILLATQGRSASDDDRSETGRNPQGDGFDATKERVSSDSARVRSSTQANEEAPWSSALVTSLARRGQKKKHASETEDILGLIPADGQLDDRTASDVLPLTTDPSTVDGWFDVQHSRKKRGTRAKARVRLTITPCLEAAACCVL